MSGIVGFYNSKKSIEKRYVINAMITSIEHRGADELRVCTSEFIAMADLKRSNVVNVTKRIPVSNESKTLWIVWSGNIFNHSELKNKLHKAGYYLNVYSDDVLMLHLFEVFGDDCLNMINGQFAFAIWNTRKKEFFLARDRVGICPLYYTQNDNDFIFASEIKAILQYPTVKPTISSKSLTQIITFWTTIAPNTNFKDIYELSPGHSLIFNSDGIKINKYWTFPVFKPHEYSRLRFEDAMDQLDAVLNDAVKIRIEPDNNFGAYVSGGIDSSVIIAYIKRNCPDFKLDTFSVGFTDSRYDESFYQKMIVEYFTTNHTKLMCNENDISDNFERVVWHAETTLLRTGAVPMILLSKSVKDNTVSSVLSGEGADEILGGYNIFKEAIIRAFWAKEPSSKYRPLLLKRLYPYLPYMDAANNLSLKMFFGYKLTETSSPVYSHLLRWNNTSRIKKYFSSDLIDEIKDYNPVEEITEKIRTELKEIDILSRAQWLEAKIFMSGYLLSSQGERMTMANGIEGRYPFLDHRVIELSMKLNPSFKLNGLKEKYILKAMMKNKLPNEVINRQKQPYRTPGGSTMFSALYSTVINDFLSKEKIQSAGLFNYDNVSQLLEKMKLSKQITEIDNMALTSILSTQILYSLFIEKTNSKFLNKENSMLENNVFDINLKQN